MMGILVELDGNIGGAKSDFYFRTSAYQADLGAHFHDLTDHLQPMDSPSHLYSSLQ